MNKRSIQVLFAALVLLLSACNSESPADGFTHFVEAALAKKPAATFARLSPESRAKVEISSAKYALAHPLERLSPAEYLFHQGTLDRLAVGVKKIEVLIVKEPWAKISVETFQGDTLQAVMKKADGKWTFHTEKAPAFLHVGEAQGEP